MNLSRQSSVLGAAVLALFSLALAPSWTQAAPFTASETISDIGGDAFSRDLQRTRTDSLGSTILGTDATIITQNSINSNFGIYNSSTVTFTHNMNWISPAAASILSASLSIIAFDAQRSILGHLNDAVHADGNFLGYLNTNSGGFSTTIFAINPLWLADGILNISIDKSLLDHISIPESTLTMNYTNGATGAVPEPSSILLMASGLAGLGLYGRRKMALATTK